MRIAQIVPCLGVNSGGPSRSVYDLSKGLREAGVDLKIITQDYANNPNIVSNDWIIALPVEKVKIFEFNLEFKKLLSTQIEQNEFQLFHINSVFSYPSHIAAALALKAGIPYVIAPRGSLYKSAMEVSSKWKKRLYNTLFLKKQLNHASAVHTTCVEEMDALRQMGITSPIAIIPNSITLPSEKTEIETPDILRVCHLGRINPKKNIIGLLKAWHKSGLAQNKNAELLIIGAAQLEKEKAYLSKLHNLEVELNINNIRWVGPKDGKEKEMLLRSCSYLIMPSFSENFGMVVPEALQYGIPVIASKGTPWKVLEEKQCGWWVDIDETSLANSLIRLCNINNDTRIKMGQRGQTLVYERFSTEGVSRMQMELYSWILGECEKPSFVYFVDERPV